MASPAPSRLIAEAVKVQLNTVHSPDFTVPFTAVRKYLPLLALEELSQIEVTVMSTAVSTMRLERSGTVVDIHQTEVGIQRRLVGDPALAESNTEIDQLTDTVNEIADDIRKVGLPTYKAATWKDTDVVLYSTEHMKANKLFTAVITFHFMLPKD